MWEALLFYEEIRTGILRLYILAKALSLDFLLALPLRLWLLVVSGFFIVDVENFIDW